MYSIEELRTLVEKAAGELHAHREPSRLYDPISYMMGTGGKRLRPVLSLMTCNLFTDDIEEAVHPSLSLEVFHNFTLVHDDIMDGADIRRNQPTMHKKWNENTAILSGDVMLILAYEYLAKAPAVVLPELINVFNRTAREVCEGQQYDMDFEERMDVSEQEYLKMIKLKTSVLLAACMETGAVLGGASAADRERLYDFGLNLGLAFQLQDDILDSFGDVKTFGKAIGGDIRSNKKTYLLIKALELADKTQLAALHKFMGGDFSSEEDKLEKVLAIYRDTGVRERAEELAENYTSRALDSLNKTNVEEARKMPLREIASKLLMRDN